MGQVRRSSSRDRHPAKQICREGTHAVIVATRQSQDSIAKLNREPGTDPKKVAKARKQQTV
jgi:KaiC/GvpD/RAD55 family RecA-like ATPase